MSVPNVAKISLFVPKLDGKTSSFFIIWGQGVCNCEWLVRVARGTAGSVLREGMSLLLCQLWHQYLVYVVRRVFCSLVSQRHLWQVIKSTRSRPNKAGLDVCTSVRPSIRLGVLVEVDEWCTTMCHVARSKVKNSKSFPPTFSMGAGKWLMILKLEDVRAGFFMPDLVFQFCVTWLWTWKNLACRSQPSVPHAANFSVVNFRLLSMLVNLLKQ